MALAAEGSSFAHNFMIITENARSICVLKRSSVLSYHPCVGFLACKSKHTCLLYGAVIGELCILRNIGGLELKLPDHLKHSLRI